MRKPFVIMLATLVLAGLAYALPPLPECYHTYAQIEAELIQLQSQYPAIGALYTIGYSEQDHLPIHAFKISDNVQQEENEPAVVLVGQIHAEEVLGVETTMANINEILANSQQLPFGTWISQLEMWFIPTLTPEGHNVVSTALDPSYRKNKRDNNSNGIFDYSPFVGYDIDGADINRNFPFNWCHGDSLLAPGGLEIYDYYRGPGPGSESETQAFMNFCRNQKPVYSFIWHSSRTGNLSEKVFYPGNYGDIRPIPDLDLGEQLGLGVALTIITEDGSSGYEASASSARKGGANDWLYQAIGNMCLVIECGTQNLQPNESLMLDTIQRCKQGVYWILNRTLPFSSAVPSSSMLTGTIRNAETNAPLEAIIKVDEKHAPWFEPRKSFPETGRYWRAIHSGSYTLRFIKKGFAEHVIHNQNVNNGSWTTVNVNLQPLQEVDLTIAVVSSVTGNPIPARAILYDVENDTLNTDGLFNFATYEGAHRLEIDADGYYPFVDTLNISSGISQLYQRIVLTPTETVFSENWESGIDGWAINGPWVLQDSLAMDGYAISDSEGGYGFYAEECDVSIVTLNPIQLPVSGNPMLIFDEWLYTEWDYDLVRVEVSADNQIWELAYTNSGQQDWWHRQYVSLQDYTGQNLYFRFRLTDISGAPGLTDPGWIIDNIRIVTGSATAAEDSSIDVLPPVLLYPNYPNPFNPETTLSFALSQKSSIRMEIYNLKGQKVKTLADGVYDSGQHSLVWNGTDDTDRPVGSGVYFSRLTSGTEVRIRKLALMK